MPKVHVKKGDEVYILTGRDKGKKGKVLEVDTKNNRVTVDGVNIVSKHKKPRPPKEVEGGIKEEPAPIHASNVKLDRDAKVKAGKSTAKAKAKPSPKAKEKDAAPEKKAATKKKAKE
jgi:large subunit ribosomal protein L24